MPFFNGIRNAPEFVTLLKQAGIAPELSSSN